MAKRLEIARPAALAAALPGHPGAYITVPPAATARMIAAEFARFLGLPVIRRLTSPTSSRPSAASPGRPHRLVRSTRSTTSTLHTRTGAEASDMLKYFSERIPATFVYAGIDVARAGLFSGTRGEQIAGRFAMIPPAPSRARRWQSIVAHFEHRPAAATPRDPRRARLPPPPHRRHDRQPVATDPRRSRAGDHHRHRENHQGMLDSITLDHAAEQQHGTRKSRAGNRP